MTADAWLLSGDNTLDTMQRRKDRQRTWHLISLKHLLSGVNDSTKEQHQRGGGWLGGVQHSGEMERLTLTSGPRSCNKFGASCPERSAFFAAKNTSSICWISATAAFSTVTWGSTVHGRVQGDTDPSYDAHPYLKGSVGDLRGANFHHTRANISSNYSHVLYSI